MKNNKGYYSWIHSMKLASIEARNKGFAMKNLKEANIIRGEDDEESQEFSVGMGSRPTRSANSPANIELSGTRRPFSLEDFAKSEMMERMAGRSTPPAEHMYAEYLKALRARGTDLAPSEIDLNGDGSVGAEDSVLKNTSWAKVVSGIPSETKGISDPPLTRLPTYSLADQARQEHIRQSWKEKHRAARISARQEHDLAKRAAADEAEQEGIEGIIDRMMRGKR